PAGWVGERHYHTGDIFVYVLEGHFIVDLDGGERISIGPGEVYHEAVDKVMRAKNGSTDKPVTVLLFQVGDKGKPRVMLAE
ncbi:MAG TPA: cupin domain-containing protein, partial [Candidatus Krumholzibacteria bacterium]|nr:cupin domain-containing protein [Candidatus Krumholzibacteria bacterium]